MHPGQCLEINFTSSTKTKASRYKKRHLSKNKQHFKWGEQKVNWNQTWFSMHSIYDLFDNPISIMAEAVPNWTPVNINVITEMHSNKQAGKHIRPHLYQLKPIEFNWNRLKWIYKLYVNTKTAQVSKFSIHKSLRFNVKPLIRLCLILLKSRGSINSMWNFLRSDYKK